MIVRLWDDGCAVKLAIKFGITGLLLWLAFRSVDATAVSQLLSQLNPSFACVALLLAVLIVLSDAMLLSGVMRLFERRMPFGTALLYSVVGWFFSNVAPSTVGGDVFRAVQFARVGVPAGAAVRLIIAIRVLSFTTLVLVMFAGFPLAIALVGDHPAANVLRLILAAGGGVLLGFFLVAAFPTILTGLDRWALVRKCRTIARDFRMLTVPSGRVATAWLAALVQHLLRIAILASLSAGLGLGVSVAALFAFTPVALLISMVPVSFGGWGARELSFVYLLGAAGVSAPAALSLSIAFGLMRVLIGVIGGALWVIVHGDHFRVDPEPA
jgi:uncharacterized membrane protein YbhN (UPF0104 family)